jgi:hypothetical protein
LKIRCNDLGRAVEIVEATCSSALVRDADRRCNKLLSATIGPFETSATIGEVSAWARLRVAELAGFPADAVKLNPMVKS